MRLGFLRPLFLEKGSPPPFYRPQLSDKRRKQLDAWFIGERSRSHYMRRFDEIDKAGELIARWNWAAFAMTFGWLLYRKRYLDCFVYCVAGWSFIKLTAAISLAFLEFCAIRFLDTAYRWPARLLWVAGVWLFWAFAVGRWADAYYYRMARREIADALRLYPSDLAAQQAHLQKHGGTSAFGLCLALSLFAASLWVAAAHFVPLLAAQKEQALIYDAYQSLNANRLRVENLYRAQGCPVGLSLSSAQQNFTIAVESGVRGQKSDCAIVLTVQKAGYPIRYLNGERLIFYRALSDNGDPAKEGVWRCQSSLNRQQSPKNCL